MKKFIALLSAFALLCAVPAFPESVREPAVIPASAEEDYTGSTYENLNYRKYADHVQITDCDTSAEGEIIIPAEIDGLPVTSIGERAFSGCSGLTSVVIPDSVKTIGTQWAEDNPFSDCRSLQSISVSADNVVYSSEDGILFSKDKTELIKYPQAKENESYTIPDSVTKIDAGVFYNCTSLVSVRLPEGITEPGGAPVTKGYLGFFEGCSSLETISIPESVTTIGPDAFANCTSLVSVELSKNVAVIRDGAFERCDNLSAVVIKNPECEFVSALRNSMGDGITRPFSVYEAITIYGYENSTAQAYAKENGLKFALIESGQESSEPVAPAENMVWNGVNPDITRDGILNAEDAAVLLRYAAEYGAGKSAVFRNS